MLAKPLRRRRLSIFVYGKTLPISIVLDDDYLPIEPIQKYLRYLDSLEKSPNTVRVYANNLKLFWEFLRDKQIDWREITLEQLSDFIHWLRSPEPGVVSIQPQVSKGSEKTINHALMKGLMLIAIRCNQDKNTSHFYTT